MSSGAVLWGLLLVAAGALLLWVCHNEREKAAQRRKPHRRPPPRTGYQSRAAPAAQPSAHRSNPPRRIARSPEPAVQHIVTHQGPTHTAGRPLPHRTPTARGVNTLPPKDFPRCPICGTRNEPAAAQRIIWNAAANRYDCIHGHRFAKNGLPLS